MLRRYATQLVLGLGLAAAVGALVRTERKLSALERRLEEVERAAAKAIPERAAAADGSVVAVASEFHMSPQSLLPVAGANGQIPPAFQKGLREASAQVRNFAEVHQVEDRYRSTLESVLLGYVANRVRLAKLNPGAAPDELDQASLASTRRTLRANLPVELAEAAIDFLPQLPRP